MTRVCKLFISGALACLGGALILHLLVLGGHGAVWNGLIHLILFGWISGFIFAVNYHTMPVFTGRAFAWPAVQIAHWAAWIVGVLAASAGLIRHQPALYRLGLALEWLSGLLFLVNVLSLLRSPRRPGHMPGPPAFQPSDRLATVATKAAGLCLPLALTLLGLVEIRAIGPGWYLAAEHAATLGWMLLMIVGVAAHVLPRWSGVAIRRPDLLRLALGSHLAALALMVPALGLGITWMFGLGASLMTLALLLEAWLLRPALTPAQSGPVPLFRGSALSPISLRCIRAAAVYLALGIGLGVIFAFNRALGGGLRPLHAELNLWGFTGLLIYGMAYHMIPRFMGRALPRPRLAHWQSIVAVAGVAVASLGWCLLLDWPPVARPLLVAGGALEALAALMFAAIMLETLYPALINAARLARAR